MAGRLDDTFYNYPEFALYKFHTYCLTYIDKKIIDMEKVNMDDLTKIIIDGSKITPSDHCALITFIKLLK